jgi:hypothetical protein
MSKIFSIDDRQVFKIAHLMVLFVMGTRFHVFYRKGDKANLMILNGSSNNLAGIQDPIVELQNGQGPMIY